MAPKLQGAAPVEFVEDIFLVDWDPEKPGRRVVYRIPEAVWKDKLQAIDANDDKNKIAAMLKPLLDREVMIADVPAVRNDPPYYLADLTTIALNEPKES